MTVSPTTSDDRARRVLVVLEAGDAWPSGIVRGLIYRDLFEQYGFSAEYTSRLWPPLVRVIERRSGRFGALLDLGVRRVLRRFHQWIIPWRERKIVERARHADTVYLSKVLSLSLFRALRRETHARLVLDFGDAVWQWGRAEDFEEVMRLVDAVTTDNEYTAAYVRRFNPECTVVPDTPQLEAFDRRRHHIRRDERRPIVIGWVGTPGTAHTLYVVWEALERLVARHPDLHVRLVGTGYDSTLLPPFTRVRYSVRPFYGQADMVDEVLAMDIGLFPLPDVEAAAVRGVLKATVYMAGEVAVAASRRGQCVDLISDGVNGVLADSTAEWEAKLEQLVTNDQLRRRIAAAGLDTVRAGFRVEQSFARLKTVLEASPRDGR